MITIIFEEVAIGLIALAPIAGFLMLVWINSRRSK